LRQLLRQTAERRKQSAKDSVDENHLAVACFRARKFFARVCTGNIRTASFVKTDSRFVVVSLDALFSLFSKLNSSSRETLGANFILAIGATFVYFHSSSRVVGKPVCSKRSKRFRVND
jgi:hypothetical protein